MLAIGLMVWVVYKIEDKESAWNAIKEANYLWVLLAAFAGFLSHLIRAIRWKMLIEPLGYESRIKTGFYAIMVGYMVNYVTPRFGEVMRCALKNRTDKVPIDKLAGTVFTERVFDLIITALITLAAIIFQYDLIWNFLVDQFNQNQQNGTIKLIILGALPLMGIVGIIIFNKIKSKEIANPVVKKVIDFISGLLDGAKSIFKLKRPFLFIFYTLAIWFMYLMVSYLIFFAVDGTSHLGMDAALTTLIMATIAVIIPAPNIGGFHYFVPLGLASLYGINKDIATSYAIISHASQMLMICIIGGISFYLVGIEEKRKNVIAQNID